jgi:hypothetical protein
LIASSTDRLPLSVAIGLSPGQWFKGLSQESYW